MTDGQHEAQNKSPWFGDKSYDVMKFVALILLPAIGALYFSLAGIWNLPNAEQVVGTITVVDTFLGVLLNRAKARYDDSDEKYDGVIDVRPDEENGVTNLNVRIDPNAVVEKDTMLVKVNKAV